MSSDDFYPACLNVVNTKKKKKKKKKLNACNVVLLLHSNSEGQDQSMHHENENMPI